MDVPREVHLATASGIDWLILVRICLRETENVVSEYFTDVNAFADAAGAVVSCFPDEHYVVRDSVPRADASL